MFVMDNRQANRDWDGSLEKLKSILSKHGAELVRTEKWGERKLAYEMQGRRRGTYMLMYFNATGTAVNEIYRECELSGLMLRALIIKIEKMPSEEMMRNPEEVTPSSRYRSSSSEERERAPAAPAAPAQPKAAPAVAPAAAAAPAPTPAPAKEE
jgi:small subunit ribosomal protein S6